MELTPRGRDFAGEALILGAAPISLAAASGKQRRNEELTGEEYRLLARADTTEKIFTQQVRQAAEGYGWRVYHFHDSRLALKDGTLVGDSGAKGFPDMVLIREVVLYRELKRVTGTLDRAQVDCMVALVNAHESAEVWRPSDWDTRIHPSLYGRWRRDEQGKLYVENR